MDRGEDECGEQRGEESSHSRSCAEDGPNVRGCSPFAGRIVRSFSAHFMGIAWGLGNRHCGRMWGPTQRV